MAAPAELRSSGGVLEVELHLRNVIDQSGLMRYCYIDAAGDESPTLRVNPGDQLIIHFYNELSTGTPAAAGMRAMEAATDGSCTAGSITNTSSNLHFHGMNVSPGCQQDDVLNTVIQAGDEFDYNLQIPSNEPPGMYWYHPHPHGYSEGQAQGGATGAIIVEGIQSTFPALAAMPERTLVLRDQPKTAVPVGGNYPTWDMSLNYVPVLYPAYTQAVIQTLPSEAEFWRLANQAADTIFQVQFLANGSAIPVQVYAIDGVPVSTGPLSESSLLLPPGSRVEFVFNTPAAGQQVQMITQNWDTGPTGDSDPQRPIAQIVSSTSAPALARLPRTPAAAATAVQQRFASLADATPTVQRTLAFSEDGQGDDGTSFYITVAGQIPAVFQPGQSPNIVLHAGTVEQWTIQNTAEEDHVFHIHQIHFQVLDVNGQPVTDPALRDTINIPHWSGSGAFPSVTLKMDFRDTNIVGTFPFHCHILEHEDGGMMGVIQVLPVGISTTTSLASSTLTPGINSSVQITASVAPAGTGPAAPAGIMQFLMNGGSSMWQSSVTNGTAVLSTTLPATGNYTFTAVYQGDVNYAASQSAPLALTVSSTNFTLAAASSIVIANPGSSGTTAISVASLGGFNGAVNFTCAVPAAMTGAGCSFNPATVSGSGKTVLTVTTSGPSAALPANPASPVALASSTLSLGLLGLLMALRRRALVLRAGLFCAIALLVVAGGCGSGSHAASVTPSGSSSTQTPAGSYTVTVTATSGTGAAKLSNTLDVAVQVN